MIPVTGVIIIVLIYWMWRYKRLKKISQSIEFENYDTENEEKEVMSDRQEEYEIEVNNSHIPN